MSKPFLSLPCKYKHTGMTKQEAGYYCANCDKVLVDFRKKSDIESKALIAESPGKVCGIFHQSQVDYKTSRISLSATSNRIALSLLGILGFLGPVISSCESTPPSNQQIKKKAFNTLRFPMTVTGQLTDEKSGEALKNAPIEIQQNGKTILRSKTDDTGNFELVIQEKDLLDETFDLIYQAEKHIADTLNRQQLKNFQRGKKLQLTLKAEVTACKVTRKTNHNNETEILGDVMIAGEIAPEKIEEPILMGKFAMPVENKSDED